MVRRCAFWLFAGSAFSLAVLACCRSGSEDYWNIHCLSVSDDGDVYGLVGQSVFFEV